MIHGGHVKSGLIALCLIIGVTMPVLGQTISG